MDKNKSFSGKILIVCLLAFTASCSGPDNSMFPLQQGIWWQYSIKRFIRGEPHVQKIVESTLPAVKIKGEKLIPKKRPDGRVEYFQRNSDGVYKVDPETGAKVVVIKEPTELGTNWSVESKILYLKVTGAFESTYNRKIKNETIPVKYEITALNETVEVAAGKFRNCIKVEGKGSIYGGGGSLKEFMAIDTINIETTEWYAPGIGLIKRQRKEYTHPLEFENNYSVELEQIKTPG